MNDHVNVSTANGSFYTGLFRLVVLVVYCSGTEIIFYVRARCVTDYSAIKVKPKCHSFDIFLERCEQNQILKCPYSPTLPIYRSNIHFLSFLFTAFANLIWIQVTLSYDTHVIFTFHFKILWNPRFRFKMYSLCLKINIWADALIWDFVLLLL